MPFRPLGRLILVDLEYMILKSIEKATMATNPVILITGASSGIGETAARLFAKDGFNVVLAARRIGILDKLAKEINSNGGRALPIRTDLMEIDDIHNLVEKTLQAYEKIDVLFNNAGFGKLDWLDSLDPVQDIQAQVHVNLIAVMQLTREVLPSMIKRRSGHIINIASMAGYVGTPTYTVYAATKFGLRGFSEALRREVGIYGIKVSTLYPGAVDTEFGAKAKINRKTGRTTPFWLRLSSEQVVRVARDIVNHPRRTVIMPWQMKFVVSLNQYFPGFVDVIIDRWFTHLERD